MLAWSQPQLRVALLSACQLLVAIGLHLWSMPYPPVIDTPLAVTWPVMAVLYTLTHAFPVHLRARRDSLTFTFSEAPLIIGLFFMSPAALLLARVVGAGVALALFQRQRALKLGFNLTYFALETAVATTVFHGLMPLEGGIGPQAWVASFIAGVAAGLLSAIAVTAAIWLHEGRPEQPLFTRAVLTSLATAAVNVSFGLTVVIMLSTDPRAGWLLIAVGAILALAYWAYGSLRTRHENMEMLYEFSRAVQQTAELSTLVRQVLLTAQRLLDAELAELFLEDHDGGDGVMVATVRGDEEITVARQPSARTGIALRHARRAGRALLVDDSESNAAELLAGLRHAVIAPLDAGTGVIGAVLAGDRAGQARGFGREHTKLAQALADQVSVALENNRLVAQLRQEAADREHQALHSSLTNLPNRALFNQRVDEAATAAINCGSLAAVLLMDLDRFKEINDTLGHRTGDQLLTEIGARLSSGIAESATIAHLGGDEFAILLPGIADDEAALDGARHLRAALERPFVLGALKLDVDASIGAALCPEHGVDSTTLLQRADVAMYAAKETQTGIELYRPERDPYSASRLALVGELRRALEAGELAVHYQPKATLDSGRVVGVEALLRWQHPLHGPILPEEFVSMAERTGLIGALTGYVLTAALQQCRAWRRAGLNLDLAVNISARNLLDEALPDQVGAALRTAAVPAAALTLELTESSIMTDHHRTIGVLQRLAGMGIRLAIDDFGTGHSSLSYLKRLPLDELKIDKSFVVNFASDENDAVIVRSTIDLARNLRLSVVAEGVEDRATWSSLRQLGCGLAQGFFISRPLTAARLEQWLASWESSTAGRGDDQDTSVRRLSVRAR